MSARASRAAVITALTGPTVGLFAVPVVVSGGTSLLQAPAWLQVVCGVVAWACASAYHYSRAAKLRKTVQVADDSGIQTIDLAEIRTLVATADTSKGTAQAVGTLMSRLPNLNEVHLIVGNSSAADQAALVNSLTQYATTVPRPLRVNAQPLLISPMELPEHDQHALHALLAKLANSDGVWVDVTGGTKAMTVAATRAATAVGLPTCYVAMDRTKEPAVFFGVVDITP
jgi:hypothetical protein